MVTTRTTTTGIIQAVVVPDSLLLLAVGAPACNHINMTELKRTVLNK